MEGMLDRRALKTESDDFMVLSSGYSKEIAAQLSKYHYLIAAMS